MKTTPLLFRAEMVRAILGGRKTQTRRLVKPQPINSRVGMVNMAYCGHPHEWCVDGSVSEYTVANPGNPKAPMSPPEWKAPLGQPGDQIWVKETFASTPGAKPSKENGVIYRADHPDSDWLWKPSIFMPRWASRITLELTAVRVERLNEISEADAIAEGVNPHVEAKWWQGYRKDDPLIHTCAEADENGNPPDWIIEAKPYRDLSHLNRTAKQEYAILWEYINGLGSWAANPWVWVYEFKKL